MLLIIIIKQTSNHSLPRNSRSSGQIKKISPTWMFLKFSGISRNLNFPTFWGSQSSVVWVAIHSEKASKFTSWERKNTTSLCLVKESTVEPHKKRRKRWGWLSLKWDPNMLNHKNGGIYLFKKLVIFRFYMWIFGGCISSKKNDS